MVAVVTVLLALPLGYLVRTRSVANTTYAVAYLWAFVFQTLYLSLDGSAFSPGEFPWSYGLVTATVFAVGFGLVAIGHEARRRRPVRHPVAITDPVARPDGSMHGLG